MSPFNFYYPLQVRYSDFDTQWHVNNARFVTFLEQARLNYVIEIGLYDGASFFDFPFVIADVHVAYKKPIILGESIRVGVRIAHIGNKSVRMEYQIENPDNGEIKAVAETVLVAFDFHRQQSLPVPDAWRKKIEAFEKRRFE